MNPPIMQFELVSNLGTSCGVSFPIYGRKQSLMNEKYQMLQLLKVLQHEVLEGRKLSKAIKGY